jgi:hypothetical protein
VNAEDAVTIVDAGAVPLLVHLLGPGALSGVQAGAARALGILAANSENAVTIATAGAIPPLAQLLKSGADDDKTHWRASETALPRTVLPLPPLPKPVRT